jgi:hypothetical protein
MNSSKYEAGTATKPADEKGPPWFTRSAVKEALKHGGCVICRDVSLSERRSIFTFLREGMMSREVREDFLKGGGFCRAHFRLAKFIEEESWPAGGIGMAILCEQLVGRVRAGLDAVKGAPSRTMRRLKRSPAAAAFFAGSGCMFCRENRERAEGHVEALEKLIEEDEFRGPLSGNPLCVAHAQMALRQWKHSEKRQWLRGVIQRQIADLEKDLREFIEKHDYRRRGKSLRHEGSAVLRAMEFLTGLDDHPSRSSPMPRDSGC